MIKENRVDKDKGVAVIKIKKLRARLRKNVKSNRIKKKKLAIISVTAQAMPRGSKLRI